MATHRHHSQAVIVLAVTLTLGLSAAAEAVEFAGGTGEPNDPYQIATAEQLIAIGSDPNLLDSHFVLVSDIDLDPNLPRGQVFYRALIAPTSDAIEPNVTFQGTPFSGVFDGNDHTISNLTIRGVDYLGLFGRVTGSVKNLRLAHVEISGSGYCAGGLMGYDAGAMTYCHSDGLVRGNTYVGGLVGAASGTMTGCRSDGVTSGNHRLGGLVGHNSGYVTTSCSSCVVIGAGGRIGGLVGYNSGRIAASSSTSSVSGTDAYVGGFAGCNDRGSIIASYSAGTVSANKYVGGFVGYDGYGTIIASYSTATVVGTNYVGGFVGYAEGDIFGSYSVGQVAGTGEYVGGLVGRCLGLVTYSFWDIENSGMAKSSRGVGKTTAQMQDIETFLAAGWDFADETANGTCDYWQASPGGYPRLRYCESDGPVMPQGLGTAQEPYLIRDARDLGTIWFKPAAHYRLVTSIDLSGITWSMAVVPSLQGTFDGSGFVIGNLQVRGRNYLGLFGTLGSKAVISHLGLEAVVINGTGDYVGGLVGYNRGDVSTSFTTGSVTGCDAMIGGLAGYNGGGITASYSTCAVTGTNKYPDGTPVGVPAIGCRGRPPGPGSSVGGLVGSNHGSITTSYSNGPVSGTGTGIGGLVGNDNVGRITACYSSGTVRGGMAVGGLVGVEYANVTKCSFWDITASGRSKSACGTGKKTVGMQTAGTFINAGWDFVEETANGTDDIWMICEGKDYPRLRWEGIACQ